MMIDQKPVALVDKLYGSTAAGKVDWKQTAISDAYETAFSGYALEIAKESHSGDDIYVIRIRNENGDLVEEFSDEDLDGGSRILFEDLIYYRLMRKIHEIARRTALESDRRS